MIAAAERREKKHKNQTKTIKHVTKSTLLKQQQQEAASNVVAAAGPQTEESRRAALAAKQGEADLAAELGYNPYEAVKKTAGQARSATTTTQHGAITAPGGGGGGSLAPPPAVAPPLDLNAHATAASNNNDEDIDTDDPRFHDFEVALAIVASSGADDPAAAKNGLKIARKLTTNATTKGQAAGADSEKFRRVRLANPKIKAAVVDVPGNLDLMLAVGFVLVPDETVPDESLLVYPSGTTGPKWLPRALAAMEAAETSVGS